MDDRTNKAFQNSLDITNEVLENYIPQLLQGLWELGSVPEYIIELLDRNSTATFTHVLDLGCGKGAVLIKLAKHFDIKGLGVDIIPGFIEQANRYAKKHAVSDKVAFKSEDLVETIKATSAQDLVIYGYDSEILGDLSSTLKQLSKCIKEDGYLLLEFMFTKDGDNKVESVLSEGEMIQTIEETGYNLLDRINWDKERVRQINWKNTQVIKSNVKRLGDQFPDKKGIFQEYVQNQIAECEELESKYTCTTLLLGNKNCCAYSGLPQQQ